MNVLRPLPVILLLVVTSCAAPDDPIRSDVPEARDNYVAGNEFLTSNFGRAEADSAVARFEAAVAADPEFAQAWAGLARARVWLVSNFAMPGQLEPATAAAAKAEALEPNTVETHLAKGYIAYRGHRDYDAALAEFLAVEEFAAEDPDVAGAIGNTYRRQGKLDDALRYFERRVSIDPEHRIGLATLAGTYNARGDYAAAARVGEQLAATGDQRNQYWRFWPRFNSGDTAAAWAVIPDIKRAEESEGELGYYDLLQAVIRRDDQALSMITDSIGFDWGGGLRYELSQYLARSGRATEHSEAFETWIAGRTALLDSAQTGATNVVAQSGMHAQLALLEALRRNTEAAESHVAEVESLNLMAKDSWSGVGHMYNVAMTHVVLGNHGRALEILESHIELGRPPGAAWLELHPSFDPLRGNPRFDALVTRTREMERPLSTS